MLSNAAYPTLWDRRGYPRLVELAALSGTVVHRSVETIVKAFHRAQCSSIADPRAVEVLRNLGGYSSIVGETMAAELDALRPNPRMAPRVEMLETAARLKAPEMRSRVQVLISRLRLQPSADAPVLQGDPDEGDETKTERHRPPLRSGSYPEVELVAAELRLRGIADLITVTPSGCSITDYKTGIADAGHAEQIRDYALLWTLDRERNPRQVPVDSLTISYVSRDEAVTPPSALQLSGLAADLTSRVSAADEAVEHRPPEARPDPSHCSFCSVRQLCETYWKESIDAVTLPDGSFGDVELEVQSRHSGRGWRARSTQTGKAVLLRVQDEGISFRPGALIRVLRVSISVDPESDVPIVAMTKGSEVYHLASDAESR